MAWPRHLLCAHPGCNQRKARDSDLCGSHRQYERKREETQTERQELVARIYAADTIDDLQNVLVDIVDRLDWS